MLANNFMLLTKQGGILKPFAYLLGLIMDGIFWVIDKLGIPNTGLAIVLFTIVIYALMIPLTVKQQKFSKLQAKMSPELQAIQAKYKGKSDQDSMMAMQQETQAVYAKYGVSPSGSCVQLLIQMPILFALYRVIYNMPAYVTKIGNVFQVLSAKIVASDNGKFLLESEVPTIQRTVQSYGKAATGENIVNGVTDVLNRLSTDDLRTIADHYNLNDLVYEGQRILSTYDATGHIANKGLIDQFNTFLGMNIANSPKYTISAEWAMDERNWGIIIGVLLIPILSALTQWINTKLMPQQETNKNSSDQENAMMASMKTMNNVMPLMSAFFCFTLPVGMGIYWVAGSVVRSIIQIAINKHIDKMDIDEMVKKNMEKINEKRKKQGLPPQQLTSNATKNTKYIEKSNSESKKLTNASNQKAKVKESTDYYKNANGAKEGSLASKAFMVKNYNEKSSSKKSSDE